MAEPLPNEPWRKEPKRAVAPVLASAQPVQKLVHPGAVAAPALVPAGKRPREAVLVDLAGLEQHLDDGKGHLRVVGPRGGRVRRRHRERRPGGTVRVALAHAPSASPTARP